MTDKAIQSTTEMACLDDPEILGGVTIEEARALGLLDAPEEEEGQ